MAEKRCLTDLRVATLSLIESCCLVDDYIVLLGPWMHASNAAHNAESRDTLLVPLLALRAACCSQWNHCSIGKTSRDS